MKTVLASITICPPPRGAQARRLIGIFLSAIFLSVGSSTVTAGEPTYTLKSSRQVGQIARVSATLEIGGEVLTSPAGKTEKTKEPVRTGVNVVCNRDYDEKMLEMQPGPSGRWRSVRCYDKAEALLKSGENSLKPALRAERSLIGVDLSARPTTLFCPKGPLTREELELLDSLGNSLMVDWLLPEGPVAAGQKWRPSDRATAALLTLDEVTRNELEAVLKEATPDVARIELAGRVEGRVRGAASKAEVKAKCRFDRKTGRVDWLAMFVKEKRDRNVAGEDALDITAKLQMRITPKEESPPLAEAALKDAALEASPPLLLLMHRPEEGDWQITYDRAWFPLHHRPTADSFTMVMDGQSIAVCQISTLPKAPAERPDSLARFQEDAERALKKNFREFVETNEFRTAANCRVYRVIAAGRDDAGPARWHHYLATDEQGRRVAFAFRVGREHAERFGQTAEEMVRSLRFVAAKSPAAEKK